MHLGLLSSMVKQLELWVTLSKELLHMLDQVRYNHIQVFMDQSKDSTDLVASIDIHLFVHTSAG